MSDQEDSLSATETSPEREEVRNERHKERMARLKAKVDERIEAAQDEKGLLLVLTGNGKGKSTSGFGMVTRAVGHGFNAGVAQFIKGSWECGERNVLSKLGVKFYVMGTGFTWNTQDREKDIAAAEETWRGAKKLLSDANIDVVMLDELTYMLSYHYLDLDEVLDAIANRPPDQHVIVTGRGCHKQLMEMADTVSEVQNTKHAFDSGFKAQKGIDW